MKIILNEQETSIEGILSCLINFKAENGSAVLMGSKEALSKIKPTTITKVEKVQFLRDGYLASFNGYVCIPIPMTYKLTPFRSIFDVTNFLITTKEEGYEIARHFNESVK